jgi:uncharacterized membrane protein
MNKINTLGKYKLGVAAIVVSLLFWISVVFGFVPGRFIASLLLLYFFPGYAIVRIFLSKDRRPHLEYILYGIGLSILLNILINYVLSASIGIKLLTISLPATFLSILLSLLADWKDLRLQDTHKENQ